MARHLKEVKGKKNGTEKQKTEAPADKEHNTSSYYSPDFSKNQPVIIFCFYCPFCLWKGFADSVS